MYAPSLPEAWEIEEMNRMRRIRESEAGERAVIPLPLPLDEPAPAPHAPTAGQRVVVIELW